MTRKSGRTCPGGSPKALSPANVTTVKKKIPPSKKTNANKRITHSSVPNGNPTHDEEEGEHPLHHEDREDCIIPTITMTKAAPKANGLVDGSRSKAAVLPHSHMNGISSVSDHSIHDSSRLLQYSSPAKSNADAIKTKPPGPLYRMIDKSQSYTKSPPAVGSRPTSQSQALSTQTPKASSTIEIGNEKRPKKLRQSELALLNDEAENFMFPRAKDENDSDGSDIILIVNGKRQKVSSHHANNNVDDKTMALIKSEMGEADLNDMQLGPDVPKSLLPLKKRFSNNSSSSGMITPRSSQRTNHKIPITETLAVATAKEISIPITNGPDEVMPKVEEETSTATNNTKKKKGRPAKGTRGKAKGAAARKSAGKNKAGTGGESQKDNNSIEGSGEDGFSNLTRIMHTEEVRKCRFAFERVPSTEPWYAAFFRQDEGEENIFEYYGSTNYKKLPYEMGPLPPLPVDCCPLSHLPGTPLKKSPRKSGVDTVKPQNRTPQSAAPPAPKLSYSARITQTRNKKDAAVPDEGSRHLPCASVGETEPPPIAASSSISANKQLAHKAASLPQSTMASITKRMKERKRKLLAELEHPRKSPREHASTLAILSCLLQQQQQQQKQQQQCKQQDCNKEGYYDDSEEQNSESMSERRDSACGEMEAGTSDEMIPTTTTTTTTDGETTETDQSKKSGTAASRSKNAGKSGKGDDRTANRRRKLKSRDTINPQELNREIETLLTDPLNTSTESIDLKLLDKSDAFLTPFRVSPDFRDLVLSVNDEDYRQGYVKKSFTHRKPGKKSLGATGGLQWTDYHLRNTKKRKNRTGWPTNKRRISVKREETKSRSLSCDLNVVNNEESVGDAGKGDHIELDSRAVKRENVVRSELKVEIFDEEDDTLQKSPILRQLLTPQKQSVKREQQHMTRSSPVSCCNAVAKRKAGAVPVKKEEVTDLCAGDVDMDCDSFSSLSMLVVSDMDTDGLIMSSDAAAKSSPVQILPPLKQSKLNRFFTTATKNSDYDVEKKKNMVNNKKGLRNGIMEKRSPTAAARPEEENNEEEEEDKETEEIDSDQEDNAGDVKDLHHIKKSSILVKNGIIREETGGIGIGVGKLSTICNKAYEPIISIKKLTSPELLRGTTGAAASTFTPSASSYGLRSTRTVGVGRRKKRKRVLD